MPPKCAAVERYKLSLARHLIELQCVGDGCAGSILAYLARLTPVEKRVDSIWQARLTLLFLMVFIHSPFN